MSVTSDDTPKKSKAKKADRNNDPARFMDPGLNYRGKLIGAEDVQEPRGDKMCLVAMAKLKAAVKTIGDHKQKIVINVSIDGIKIIDEKTESLVYFHPVHRISFISRDPNDSRAFGYVFGAGGGSHQFYGIKTEKVAEGIVLCLRDLFQVVFELKKQGSETSKRSLEVDDRVSSDPRSFSSPKPTSTRGIKLKSDPYSQSPTLPTASQSPLSAESCRGSVTPVSVVKRGVVGMSNVHQSPVLSSCSGNPPKQGVSNLPHRMSRPATTTPEPIYQNASVLTGRFHCQMQSSVTSSAPPETARLTAPDKFHLPESVKEWVSFERERPPVEGASEMRPSARRKDPFANDPFFSKTPGSEESGEVIVWSQVETCGKAALSDASNEIRVEPIYGFFVEPGEFADFSGFKEESVASGGAAWVPVETGFEGITVAPGGALDATGPAPEAASDRESTSDVVSFPSPDAPPPPLPHNTPVLLDHRAPVPPPRPGSSCSKSGPSTTVEHSFDRWVDGVPPALPSRPFSLDDPGTGPSEIPPSPPPRSDLEPPSKSNAPWVDCAPDPFAVAISKRATKTDSSVGPMSARTPLQFPPRNASKGQNGSHALSPIPPRNTGVLEDSTTTLCDETDRSFSRNNDAGEFHDPFSSLDPFATKDPFASVSFGSATSDPFGKRFSADSNVVTTDSDTFDDVFSSRDDSDERPENGSRSLMGSRDLDTSRCVAVNSSTPARATDFPDSNQVEKSRQESKFDPQSSFDSVMDDFSRRFPSFDDNWSALAAQNPSASLPDAHPADSLRPTGGATAGKSRLSIPKSSDSSSNSEIAEAFCDDGNFSSGRGLRQQAKS